MGMEKAGRITKRRAPDADVEGQRKKSRANQAGAEECDDEVEEFFAILRRMHDAVKYFERASGGDGRKRDPATWRSVIETGADELAVSGRLLTAEQKEPPGKERGRVELDLNALPEESPGGD